jgi:hypothetical protein
LTLIVAAYRPEIGVHVGASCSTRRRPKGGFGAPHPPGIDARACAPDFRNLRFGLSPTPKATIPREPVSATRLISKACHFDFKHSAPGGDDLCDEAQAAIVRGHYDMRRLVPLILVPYCFIPTKACRYLCGGCHRGFSLFEMDTLLSLAGNPASVSPGCRGMRYHL